MFLDGKTLRVSCICSWNQPEMQRGLATCHAFDEADGEPTASGRAWDANWEINHNWRVRMCKGLYGTQGGLSMFRIGVFPLWILPIKSLRQIRCLSLRWSPLADREMCLHWSRERVTLPKLCGLEVAKTNENQRPGFPYRFSMFSWSFNQRLQACACTLTYILACQMYIYFTLYYWPWA